jgi:hypothetical protein
MQKPFPWAALTAISGTLTFLALGGLGYMAFEMHRDAMRFAAATLESSSESAKHLKQMAEPGTWVVATDGSCYTNRTDVTCTFTNIHGGPITTCSKGTLVQKDATRGRLESVTMCTGKLQPNETKTVIAPWKGGFADDLCFKETSYGKQLDWSKCVFDTEPVDASALRKAAIAAK